MPDEPPRLNTRGLDVDHMAKLAFDNLNQRFGGNSTDVDTSGYTRATGLATLALLAEMQKLRSAIEALTASTDTSL